MIRLTRGTLVVDELGELGEPTSAHHGQRVYERSTQQVLQWDAHREPPGWVVVETLEEPEMPW
jgi:hypothetical protein